MATNCVFELVATVTWACTAEQAWVSFPHKQTVHKFS